LTSKSGTGETVEGVVDENGQVSFGDVTEVDGIYPVRFSIEGTGACGQAVGLGVNNIAPTIIDKDDGSAVEAK
jgi:hypothetical protein